MIPSSRQETVYYTFENVDVNILIQAVAGGAKTTTLMGILERAKYRTLFLAFNKSIQEEIQTRIKEAGYEHAKAMTLHSLGLSAIRYKHGHFKIQNNKNYQMIRALQDYNRSLFAGMSWEDKVKTTMTLMEMNDVSRIYLTNNLEEILEHLASMDKYFYLHDNLLQLWTEFIFIRDQFEKDLIIDFIDMIYLVVKQELLIPVQPYYLMIDEAQDLNLAQHRMIDQLLAQGDVHKWVAVGDRRQAIYGFSGSFASSFDLFKDKGNVYELPLDVCYRCPQGIIREANKVYDVIEHYKEYEGIVDTIDKAELIKKGSMVICRNTSPLINLYFQLIAQGNQVFIKGEDILSGLLRFLKPYEKKTVKQTISSITVELVNLKEKERKSDEDRYRSYKLNENLNNLKLLQEHYCQPSDKVEVIIHSLTTMFQEINSEDVITLCTIHKAKGLESDVVYILNEDLIPSKFAKSPSQLEQEQNLKYVARTRAKEEMYYLNLKDV